MGYRQMREYNFTMRLNAYKNLKIMLYNIVHRKSEMQSRICSVEISCDLITYKNVLDMISNNIIIIIKHTY